MRIIQNPQRKDDKFEDYHYPPNPSLHGRGNEREETLLSSISALTHPVQGEAGRGRWKTKSTITVRGRLPFRFPDGGGFLRFLLLTLFQLAE